MNIYVEQLSEVGRQEDASPDEGSTWYNTGAPYSGNSASFSSLSSFNGVLLEPATSSQSNIDAQTEEIYITTKDRIRGVSKEYKCDRCFAVFNNSSNLKSHQRTHTGERPYVCDVCNAAFVQSSNLKSHRRIHTGERPFICKECGQTFARSSHLTGHKRTHTGEKPYMCGICNSNFTTSTHLRNHMRKHTGEKPYACHLCDMTFNQNSSLQIHLLVHTGERPFKCMACPGAFRSKRDLLSHERLHSQVKPFLCHNCEKCFKTNQYLQKHLKKCGVPVIAKKRGRPRGNYSGASHMLSPNGRRIIRSNRSKSNQEMCSYKDSSPEESEHPDVPDFFEEF